MSPEKLLVSADVDRWLFGEAWTGSRIQEQVRMLCDTIGPRWSGTDAEWQTIEHIEKTLQGYGLDRVDVEEFCGPDAGFSSLEMLQVFWGDDDWVKYDFLARSAGEVWKCGVLGTRTR